jgi:RimJ/RimL family protein N-acetyltransferase
MAHWTKILADGSVAKKTVVFRGEVAGNVVAFDRGGKRLVGYWIGTKHWGRGIASRALEGLLDHVAERPLYAFVATHNIASRRVLEKCGFTEVRRVMGDDGVEEAEMVLRALEAETA